MSSTEGAEPKTGTEGPNVVQQSEIDTEQAAVSHARDLDEKAGFAEYKGDAIDAENAEHDMGVLQAVRAYPMASFWAVVMSSTIVGGPLPDVLFSPGEL